MRRAFALTAVFVLLMSFPCVARQSAAAQMDFIGDLVNSVVMFAPKGELSSEFSASPVRIFPEEFAEMAQVFIEAVQVLQRSGERRRAHLLRLRAQGIEEEPMSMAGAAFEFNLFGCRFAFDRYGYMHFDDRFVRPAERKTIERAEAIYRRMHKRWMAAQAAKSMESKKKSKSAAIADRAAEWRVRRVPVFKGFEDDRYQEHDALIVRCVDEFNRNRAAWAGATCSQAKLITPITTALVKAHLIEETGGRDAKSVAAWEIDPGQVNVPGDWSEAKAGVGLVKPAKRNEGTAEGNIRAAIKFLVRKGFGVSGQPASRRPKGVFDDWRTALRRYNGRDDEMVDGRSYSETYADHILARAKNPGRFVAIRKKAKR
jgi:hypothetical protein